MQYPVVLNCECWRITVKQNTTRQQMHPGTTDGYMYEICFVGCVSFVQLHQFAKLPQLWRSLEEPVNQPWNTHKLKHNYQPQSTQNFAVTFPSQLARYHPKMFWTFQCYLTLDFTRQKDDWFPPFAEMTQTFLCCGFVVTNLNQTLRHLVKRQEPEVTRPPPRMHLRHQKAQL